MGSVITGIAGVQLTKTIVWMCATAAAAGVIYEASQLGDPMTVDPIVKINISKEEFGARPQATGCDPSATKNINSIFQNSVELEDTLLTFPQPLCLDFDCLSNDNQTCAVVCSFLLLRPIPSH